MHPRPNMDLDWLRCRNPENESMKEGKNEDIEECDLLFQFLLMHAVRNFVWICQRNLCPILTFDFPPARNEESRRRTEVLRGWLSTEQTSELSAMMEEDEASLHGVILAAALTATARVINGLIR